MFRIHFLDVGHGDTTVLQFDNGRTYLIDHNEAIGKTPPIDYLVEALEVRELETVVITHPHIDHFLGIHRILEAMPIRQVWLSDVPFVGVKHGEFKHRLEIQSEIRVLAPSSGTAVTEGKDRIRVLAPSANFLRGTHEDVNNASLVLKITIAHTEQDTSTSAILGADAEIASWNQMLIEQGRHLHTDSENRNLLKISHHGSQHGTAPEVLAMICPQYSVISVGSNPYGHPDPDTLTLIEEHTSEHVFRTDVNGTCLFESDGLSWTPV